MNMEDLDIFIFNFLFVFIIRLNLEDKIVQKRLWHDHPSLGGVMMVRVHIQG